MRRLEEEARDRVTLGDGAMGTELHARGLKPGVCPEAWCLEHPNRVRDVHRAYLAAGSRIIETNTFGANRYKLERYGLAGSVAAICRAGAALAREVATDQAYVLASMGPTGAFLEPYGDETEDRFFAAFREQALAFEHGGADAVIVETMTAMEECCVAIRAVRENTGLTCVASLTFDPLPEGGYASMMGVTPEVFAVRAVEAGAHIVGSNCGLGPEHMTAVIARLRAATTAPLLAMPNAGMPTLQAGRTVFPASPEDLAAAVRRMIEAGATIVGGCCGTTPTHIEAMARALRGLAFGTQPRD